MADYLNDDDELNADDLPDVPAEVQPLSVSPDQAKQQQMKDYLAQQYAKAADKTDVNKARETQGTQDLIANLGQAFEGIARANSMAHGGQGVNQGLYNNLRDQASRGVQNAEANRQNAIQQFVQNKDMGRQVNQDQMAQANFDLQQKEGAVKLAATDGNSDVSKNAVAGARALFKDKPNVKEIFPDGMSAIGVENTMKGLKIKTGEDTAKSIAGMRVDAAKAGVQNKQDAAELAEAHRQQRGLNKDLDPDTASPRTAIGQAINKVHSATRLMTFADVTPEEVAAANKDPQVKAALIQKLDNLTPQQYSEVVSGLMSQLTNGGTGSLGQFEHLKANTGSQTAANIKQYFDSNPAPAGMGSMIFNNLQTLKNEQNTSQDILDKHTSKLKTKYPLAFKHPATSDSSEQALAEWTSPKQDKATFQNKPEQNIGAIHPQANDALEWAKKNPNDPRAEEIMKRIGSQNAGL